MRELRPQDVKARIVALIRTSGGPAEVARLTQIPLPTLETCLYTDALPSALTLARLSSLGVTVDWLLFGGQR
mgnify:CR=1 FL=1